MEEAVIVSGVRTAIGSFLGGLSDIPAINLGSIVIKEALQRAKVEPSKVEEVLMGNILQAGLGQNPARQSTLAAGIPDEVPCTTINKVCGSGMKAVALAAQAIMIGDADIIVAGGMESMSRAPYLLEKARTGYRMGNGEIIDSMIKDGLWCSLVGVHMGITAENLAAKYGITREEQDAFAARSQQKAAQAIKEGRFKDEIIAVPVPQKKGDPILFDTDEFVRADTTAEKLAKLRPAFKSDGTVTAGNASGINDGAAALVVMSAKKAKEMNIKPLAKILGYASAGVDPAIMGIGPAPAVRKVLKKANLTLEKIDLIEANEAFAAQSLSVAKELGLDTSKLNVNGGAIALGHPVGASGARILITLLYEMKKRGLHYGLATLCIGGGQGMATIVEML